MGKTVNGMREFKCRLCGAEVSMNLYKWRKKPQKEKNVCDNCIKNREIKRQTAIERARYEGYEGYRYIF